jgi:hypothetical protein
MQTARFPSKGLAAIAQAIGDAVCSFFDENAEHVARRG